MVEELVVEDVSAILVYLVKNQSLYVGENRANTSLFEEAMNKTLHLGFKKNEISSLYARETSKEEVTQRRA